MNRIITLCVCVATLCCWPSSAKSESVLELLPGFDVQRVQEAYPPSDSKTFGELAKMVFRLQKISKKTFDSKVSPEGSGGETEIGQAAKFDGTIKSLRLLKVPEKLVEFLEFTVFQDTVVQFGEGSEARTINVISARLPKGVKVGDRVSGVGIVIEPGDKRAVVACPLQWFPSEPASDGWRLLGEAGVDVSELAQVGSRNRELLTAKDNDSFYQILSVAQEIGQSNEATKFEPKWVKPINLLKQPEKYTGDWIRMRLDTVRVTRVAVTEAARQKQLGSDHYFQVDAHGNLENVAVQIERPKGEEGPPVRFEGTYPVSLVMKKLPPFLTEAISAKEGGDAVAAMISQPIQIEGFFFRLWSYSSDFMQRQGGGNQFGPLLMVARMTDRSHVVQAGVGPEIFGYIAAVAVIGAILLVLIWTRYTSSSDRKVREKNQERESQRLDIPADAG